MTEAAHDAPRTKRRWSTRRWLIMFGRAKPPPGKDGKPRRYGTRLEDLLAFLGIRGGAIGAATVAFLKFTASNDRVAAALEAQAAAVSTASAVATQAAGTQLLETKGQTLELRGLSVVFRDEGTQTRTSIGQVRDAIGVRRGLTESIPPARPAPSVVPPGVR